MTDKRKRAELAPRVCPTCGASYRPYNSSQLACGNRACRDALPHKRERARAYHADPKNRERKNTARRLATAKDPDARREINLRNNLRQYGITPERFAEMLAEQGGKCALCDFVPRADGVKAASRLHVDHDHLTGSVRRLLCNACNRGLGYLRDSPDLLRAAADYIERHRVIPQP